MLDVRRLAVQADSDDPEVGLRAVAALRRLLEDVEGAHVRHARERGWSWEAIAGALGVTRQAVHKKHARPRLKAPVPRRRGVEGAGPAAPEREVNER